MTRELMRKREKAGIGRWTARLIGATSIATALMIPAGMESSLESAAASFNPGTALDLEQDPILEQKLLFPIYDERTGLTRDTGMDMQPCRDFEVCGTDLGQPFLLPDDSVGYLFGDTFKVAGPFLKGLESGADNYRAQVMLRSDMIPVEGEPIIFDGAAGIDGIGPAPGFLGGWHMLMNDGASLPNGDVIVSYQHTFEREDLDARTWHTDYSGLAISHDGGKTFERTGPTWENATDKDPYQMWSMQYDNGYVYIVSVRAGRQWGPMMLFRAPWNEMLDQDAYTYWNGKEWGKKADAKPIREGHFGEPSLRKLRDGTWALGYADYAFYPKIVSQMIEDPNQGPEGQWSDPKIQLEAKDLENPYGGGIHPDSTKDNLIMMISTWQTRGSAKDIQDRELYRYDVSHLIGSL